MRSSGAENMEHHGHKSRPGGLPGEACRGKHTACTACALRRSRTEQQVVVGRLEHSKTCTTQHKPPHKPEVTLTRRDKRKRETTNAHYRKPNAAKYAWMNLAYKPPCHGRDKHYYERPRCHKQSCAYCIIPERVDQQERHGHHAKHLCRERQYAGGHRCGKNGDFKQVEWQHGIFAPHL